MKVLSVVGARPQFVKAAAVSRVLRQAHTEVLVHTGQHYDDALSGVFFRQLALPRPDIHLGVGSGSHAEQTAAMLVALERVLLAERPHWVLVYGDTNSTLAGALAAAKLGARLAHVEAGLRSFNRSMPEEHNRVVTDHLADLLLCPTETAMQHLRREGLHERAHLVGDVMVDILHLSAPHARWEDWLAQQAGATRRGPEIRPGAYALLTVHRAGNTDDPARLSRILEAVGRLELPVLFPAHPRAVKAVEAAGLPLPPNLWRCEPAPYFAMLGLQRDARVILTDSGGMQKEAYVLGVPCVTLRAETEWPETLQGGWNMLVDADPALIAEAAARPWPATDRGTPFGDGQAAEAVVATLERALAGATPSGAVT
ncbi:MAG TPA: UDP-N-acetylglucosamine 2-epimerase (non-hydrolyzing) [Chloroflexota bacterium]|nr:UDP-N-acetylglucosamine 2-epimerase (non-hydrolyzing) [Chloroflexota bacterium]